MSDVYDILITMTAQYVDVIITEGQIGDNLKKIKNIDGFLKNLEVLTLSEI